MADFQQYRTIRTIGEGGMGEVLLAEDTNLQRQVAIKLLPADYAVDEERRNRFLQEARNASALNHPHVCVIYEVGETDDNRPYIAMEYIDGHGLDQLVKSDPLPIDVVIGIGIQVADALDAAHALGIVHRDIKSSNIMLNERRLAKVLDFGLAKRFTNELSHTGNDLVETREGHLVGTPNYMSPEQALGHPVDQRSDIFSLGVVFYEMATAQRPFAGETLGDTIDQIIHHNPRAMGRYNYDLPEEFERITLKCLQKDPSSRFQSAEELRLDLHALNEKLRNHDPSKTDSLASSDKTQTIMAVSPVGTSPLPTVEQLKTSDILISCAQLDDQPSHPSGEGWVSKLQRNLKVKVEQLTGEPINIQCAPLPPGEAELDETLLEGMAAAKTMLSVISPPFLKSGGCQAGIQHYKDSVSASDLGNAAIRSKLFKIVKTPVGETDISPEVAETFRQLLGFEFFDVDSETGRIREFDDSYGDSAAQRYYERIYDVAFEICQGFQQQKALRDSHVIGSQSSASHISKTVYLAETTSELRQHRDRLRRELLEQGHRVLPDQSLPMVKEELESVVQAYLSQCSFSIHMVGNSFGMVPENTSDSVVVLQNIIASSYSAEHDLKRMIWMPRDLAPTDERQDSFIEALNNDPDSQRGAEVIRDSFENLKQLLSERWEKEAANTSRTDNVSASDDVTRIYIIHELSDETAIEALEDFFYDKGIEVILPEFEGSETDVSNVHIQNLQDCDSVLIYYGDTVKSWVDIKLRELTKATGYRNGRSIDHRCVYIAPPHDRRKERFKTLTADVYRQEGAELNSDALSSFANKTREE